MTCGSAVAVPVELAATVRPPTLTWPLARRRRCRRHLPLGAATCPSALPPPPAPRRCRRHLPLGAATCPSAPPPAPRRHDHRGLSGQDRARTWM
ncbi:hypothetical protein NKG94_48130 [Micromonospora sp. M12]